jgi:predicted DNA-binding transcriptional regulator
MDNDQLLGYIILISSLIGIGIYFWLVFITPWTWLVIRASAFIAVVALLVITSWIGYTILTTPPPKPFDNSDEKLPGTEGDHQIENN